MKVEEKSCEENVQQNELLVGWCFHFLISPVSKVVHYFANVTGAGILSSNENHKTG